MNSNVGMYRNRTEETAGVGWLGLVEFDQSGWGRNKLISHCLDVRVRTVTGSRMNCRVTTVEGLPRSTGLNSS